MQPHSLSCVALHIGIKSRAGWQRWEQREHSFEDVQSLENVPFYKRIEIATLKLHSLYKANQIVDEPCSGADSVDGIERNI
jgi:hypothetical protein